MFHRKFLPITAAVLVLATSCFGGIEDQIESASERAAEAINSGVADIVGESQSWQDLVIFLESEFGDEIEGLTADLDRIAQRGISAAGAELRCGLLFIRDQVISDLQRLKAKLLGSDAPIPSPVFCNTSPTIVSLGDTGRAVDGFVEFWGYNLDNPNITVQGQMTNGSLVDFTGFVDRPGHFLMTLNISGNGALVNRDVRRIVVSWGGENQRSIGVKAPIPELCQVRPASAPSRDVTVTGTELTRGDQDLHGHPEMHLHAVLSISEQDIDVTLSFSALETKGDRSTFLGRETVTLFSAPPGFRIDNVTNERQSYAVWRGTRKNRPEPPLPVGDGLIRTIVFHGDTDGNDFGKTRAVVTVENLNIILIEDNTTCVPPSATFNYGEWAFDPQILSDLIGTSVTTFEIASVEEGAEGVEQFPGTSIFDPEVNDWFSITLNEAEASGVTVVAPSADIGDQLDLEQTDD